LAKGCSAPAAAVCSDLCFLLQSVIGGGTGFGDIGGLGSLAGLGGLTGLGGASALPIDQLGYTGPLASGYVESPYDGYDATGLSGLF
jgi:hypothetical protein